MNIRNAQSLSEPRPGRGMVRTLAVAVLLAAALAPSLAHAAVYNPLDIISYDTWRAASSMSVADIQAFLSTQSGPLKNVSVVETVTSSVPATRTAAEIIWRSAQAWNLNPKVILATLQKEQSLLTVSDSNNASRLVKAMGCGVYGTDPATGRTINRYPGFANQVFNGAAKLSTYEITYGWHPGMPKTVTAYASVTATKSVNGVVVTYRKTVKVARSIVPRNACTFSLYTYTPYYPQRNFWDIYVRYFGDTHTPPRLRPVYRFVNKGNGTYFYTSSEAKRYTLLRTQSKTWGFDGVAFTIDASAVVPAVPLYQMYDSRTHRYLYTTSESRRASLLEVRPRRWRTDGVTCYVSTVASGTTPVFALEKKSTHGLKLTSSLSYRTSATRGRSAPYAYRGVAFYLGSSEPTSTPIGPAL